jgi:hypothetical protein
METTDDDKETIIGRSTNLQNWYCLYHGVHFATVISASIIAIYIEQGSPN